MHTVKLVVGTWLIFAVVVGLAYSLVRDWEKRRRRQGR